MAACVSDRLWAFKELVERASGQMGVIEKNCAEHYTWGGICEGWHLLKADAVSIIEEKIPPSGSEVPHLHQFATQFFYVLKGTLSFEVSGKAYDLAPRQGIEIRPSIPHRIFNQGAEDAEFLVISAPPSHGDRIPL